MSEKYSTGDLFLAGVLGFILSFLIFFLTGNDIEISTLDEVCTRLSGEPSLFNLDESTPSQIICNPLEKKDEKVLDDGKIILKGYKEVIKVKMEMGPKDNEEGTRVTNKYMLFSKEEQEELKNMCRRKGLEINEDALICYYPLSKEEK